MNGISHMLYGVTSDTWLASTFLIDIDMVLTILSLVIGYLTLSISVALLYTAWFSGAGHEVTNEFLAFASVCSLGFATLSGWLTALVAQRAPIAHAIGLAILLAVVWGFSTFG
ncbi:MAG: hypothetical protein AAFY72_06510, partial [Cyanobacteria bacterium J06649_4]